MGLSILLELENSLVCSKICHDAQLLLFLLQLDFLTGLEVLRIDSLNMFLIMTEASRVISFITCNKEVIFWLNPYHTFEININLGVLWGSNLVVFFAKPLVGPNLFLFLWNLDILYHVAMPFHGAIRTKPEIAIFSDAVTLNPVLILHWSFINWLEAFFTFCI